MNWKSLAKKTMTWGALPLAALLFLVCALFGLAQTDLGQRQLAKIVAKAVTSDGKTRIEIGTLSGFIPFNFHLDRLVLSDTRGPWMAAEGLTIHWSPFSLIKGEIFVREFSVQRVNLDRTPEVKRGIKIRSERKLPSWPAEFPRLRVDHLFIHQFALAEAILGQAAIFKMETKIRAESPAALQETRILVERLDGPKMVLQFHATLRNEGALLSLDASLAEPDNGLIADILGSTGPLTLSLKGQGPVRDWKGTFRADAPPVGQCESQIQIDMGKPFTVSAKGNLALMPGFVPEALAPWVGPQMQFSVLGQFPKSNVLDLERMRVNTGDLALDFAGSLDLKKARSQGRFTLLCNDIKPLSTWIDAPSSGRLSAEGRISGPLFQPEAEIHFSSWDAKFSKLSFSNLDGQLGIQFAGPLTTAFPKVRLKGQGVVKGLSLAGSKLPPQREVHWQLELENPTGDIFLIKNGKAKGDGIQVALTGRVHPLAAQGEVDALLDVAETSVLADVFSLELPETGRTSLNSSLRGNLKKGLLVSSFRGKSAILDQRLRAILGEELEYRGHIALEKGKLLTLSDLCAETSSGTLTGDGAYDLAAKTVMKASWAVDVPKLVALSPVLKYPLDGSLKMSGALEGPLSKAKVSVEAACRDLRIGGIRLGETKATISAHGLPPESEGRCFIQVRPKDQVIHAKATYVLQGDSLALNNVLVEGASTALAGTGTIDISRMLSKGQLKGRNDNLSVLMGLFGKKMEGRANGTARFSFGESDQQIILKLEGQDLKTPFGEAQQAALQAHIEEWLKSPKGSATLEVKQGRFSELSLSSSKIEAKGHLNQIAFAASAEGRYKQNFDLEGSGLYTRSPQEHVFTLNTLKARYGQLPLALSGPARIERSKTDIVLDSFAVSVGSGVLEGKGTLGENVLSLDVSFRDLSLKESKYFGFASLRGTAKGALLLQGTPRFPEGHLTLWVDDLGFNDPQLADFPPGTLQIRAELNRQRIRGEVQLQRLTAEPFRAILDAPLNLSFSPLVCSVPSQEEISGHLDGEVDLARMVSLFGLDDQKMRGRMDFDLSLGGEAKEPRIKGKIILQNGTYENLRSGTLLKDLDVEIAASVPRLKIERARATDGEKGLVTAKGWFDILPSEGYPFQVDLTLEHAKPFRHDTASVTAGGQLTLEGSLAESALRGKLLIESAEFRIPERLPPEMTNLEVIEINREGEVIKPPQESSLPKREALKLDLSVLSPGRAFVRGRGLDSEWQGELKIMGTAGDPAITGSLGLVRGRFNFLGKHFDLTRGLISFFGKTPPVPFLDMLGEARTKDITARIQLSGGFSSPELQLSSDPSLPTDEILSRLLFGRSVTQITPLQAVQLANAANTLAGGGGMDFVGRTREVLKLDQLEVKQSGEELQEATVSAGKYISDTVYLEVEQGLGPDSGKASVQWEVTPNITVETEAGVNAEGGAGVSWKWDY